MISKYTLFFLGESFKNTRVYHESYRGQVQVMMPIILQFYDVHVDIQQVQHVLPILSITLKSTNYITHYEP